MEKEKELTEERKNEILSTPIKEEYFKDAEEAIQGGIDHKAISDEAAALAREVNAKLKEINKVEAVLMLISNCALLLDPVQCMALSEVTKHVTMMKMAKALKSK